jgi:hypothetical protein
VLKCLGARVHQNPHWQSFNIAKNLHEKEETNKTLNTKLGYAYIYMHILTLKHYIKNVYNIVLYIYDELVIKY